MAKKTNAISALMLLITQVGLSPTALAHEAAFIAKECETLLASSDRAALLRKLEFLLDENPNHNCIPLIVSLLGGSPLASVGDSDAHVDDSDRSDDDDRSFGLSSDSRGDTTGTSAY